MNADVPAATPRVLIADADQPTRTGITRVLQTGGLAVVGEAVDAETAVALAHAERPELGLVAAGLPGGCLQTLRRITRAAPRTRLIVITLRPTGEELVAVVAAGAVGYLGGDTGSQRLPEILRAVAAGEVALPRRHTQHLLDALRGRDARRAAFAARTGAALSDREWEILELMADHLATGEMAHRLGITTTTARRHISSLLRKLAVRDRSSAVDLLRAHSAE